MWRLVLLALPACWTPAAPTRRLTAAPEAHCEIRDTNIQTADPVTLMVGGIAFARIHGELSRFDVELAGQRARAHLETAELELVSDLKLSGFSLRTRTPAPHDGWLEIRIALARRETHGRIEAAIPLPPGVIPRVVVTALPCSDVTFERAPYRDDPTVEGPWLAFAPGTRTPLAKTPGGPALVHLAPGAGSSVRARLLERKGELARIELSERNTITGWVRTDHAREVPPEVAVRYGFARGGYNKRLAHCPHAVPIYVNTGTKVHRVGNYKLGAEIRYDGPPVDDPGVGDTLPVDLGGGEIEPYVEHADVVHCTPGAPTH